MHLKNDKYRGQNMRDCKMAG